MAKIYQDAKDKNIAATVMILDENDNLADPTTGLKFTDAEITDAFYKGVVVMRSGIDAVMRPLSLEPKSQTRGYDPNAATQTVRYVMPYELMTSVSGMVSPIVCTVDEAGYLHKPVEDSKSRTTLVGDIADGAFVTLNADRILIDIDGHGFARPVRIIYPYQDKNYARVVYLVENEDPDTTDTLTFSEKIAYTSEWFLPPV